MKANFNLAHRMNPQTKEKMWYAVPSSKGVLDADETATMAVADTTLSKGEYKYAMEATTDKLISMVLSGITITIGDLGKLRLSFGSKGVANLEDFDTASMIRNPKFIFTPSKTMKAALASAQANLVKTERDYKRQKALSSQQYASKSTLDTAESAYLQAKASVAQAEANLELAKIDLEHTEIKAPFTGLIGKAEVTEGNYVSSNTQTLARIIQASPIRVSFSVPDKDAYMFREFDSTGIKTRLLLPNNKMLNEGMSSFFVNNEINVNTATLPVYLEYANADRKLIAGSYVNVILSPAKETPAVIINPAAIMQDANGAYVYTVDTDGKVTECRVQLDGMFEGKQIVLSGLQGNEKVIVSGLQKVTDGATVRASLVSNQTEEAK